MNIETIDILKQEKESNIDDSYYRQLKETIKIWGRHPENLDQKKEEFIKQFPERIKEIEIFFRLSDYLQIEQEIREKKVWSKEEKLENFEFLTEWNGDATKYVIENSQDKEGLKIFWKELRNLSKNFKYGEEELSISKSGLVAQACIYQVLERLNLHPRVATPEEDINKEDLFCYLPDEDTRVAIQAKTKRELDKIIIRKTNIVRFPTVSSKDMMLSTEKYKGLAGFHGNLNDLKEKYGRNLISLEIYIPRGYYDEFSGEPTEQCMREFKEELEKYIK